MGTQVHYKDYAPLGYCDMRNLSEDGSSSNWSLFYGDRPSTNVQHCNNGFLSRSVIDAFPGYDKDAVKQKMLEHEAIFKNQVYELHRLYRIQRDMMQEAKRKEPNRMSVEPSSSSSIRGSQMPSEDARKWHMTSLPLAHSNYYARASTCSADLMSSPLSCAKDNNVQLQNGVSSRFSGEELEARPSKVRKKLFDLQLPADQYIDTDDDKQLQDCRSSLCPSYPARGNFTDPQECSVKLILGSGGGEMSSSQKEVSKMPSSYLRSSFGLADLNEPAQFEETIVAPPVDFLGCSNYPKDSKRPNVSSSKQPNAAFFASSNGLISNSSKGSKGKERDWLSYAYEADNMRNGLLPQGLEHNKLPMPSHRHNPVTYPTLSIRDDMWRERTGYGLQPFERGRESSSYSRVVEPTVAPQLFSSCPSPYVNSSEFPNLWPSVSSLEKPTSSPTQKFTFFHPNTSQSPITGWNNNNGNIVSGAKNGFCYNVSPSAPRDPPVHFRPLGFDCLNFNKGENGLPGSSTTHHQYEKLLVDSNSVDSKSAKGFDLNVMNEQQPFHDKGFFGNSSSSSTRKHEEEDIAATLPWLKATPASKNKPSREENKPSLLASTSAAITQPPTQGHNGTNAKKNVMIDINMAWDLSHDELEEDKPKATSARNHIDLNSCLPEEEDEDCPGPTAAASNNVRTKTCLEIDLEAPAVLDSDEYDLPPKTEHMEDDNLSPKDESASVAAEAIVAISSLRDDPSEDPLGESLHWLADIAASCAEDKEPKGSKDENSLCLEGTDSFEAMTLQLAETKEEDYMPKPFVPECGDHNNNNNVGPTASSLNHRPRRGQARRGRQKRDFQRDILPGLSSLSRHELAEDLQTFGGLMKAMGHPWNCALTTTKRSGARNGGGARGRRRTVVAVSSDEPPPPPLPAAISLSPQLNNGEAVFEDKSLTGWGKTTRRPRRQRYPAGSTPPPTFPLT
ncbi:hypothetical protein DM860_008255 [Cuscuta australis]|uniref:Uncharacterized protein n=1 Tax=Cuscuta australis TaxID=267555 RepID=A0A328D303_9ASTE|nr:hypothetical protein DM860_008255 [Cuscuta australis]